MKKAIVLLLSFLLILIISVGCSSKGEANDPDKDINQPENDLSKGFTYMVEDGDLKLTYSNSGNTVTLIEAFEEYEYIVYTAEDPVTNKEQFSKIMKAQLSEGGQEIYFTQEPIHGVGVTTFFIELETMDIFFIGQGTFVQEVVLDGSLTFAVLEDPWSSYLAFYTHAGGGHYYYLGEQLEADVKAQLEREISGDVDGPLNLSSLNDGDNVGGGLTIKDIYYDRDYDEEVFFTFSGELRLTGVASYSDWENAVSFELAENNLPVIFIERTYGTTYTHEIQTLHFRYCPSDRLSDFYGETIEITVKDIDVEIEFLYDTRNYVIDLIDFKVLD